MSLAEIIPTQRALPRAGELQVVQHLVGELAGEEGVAPVETGGTYPIWSPFQALDAASLLRARDCHYEVP